MFRLPVPVLILAVIVMLGPARLFAATPWTTQIESEWLQELMPGADKFSEKSGEPPVIRAWRNGEDGGRELLGYLFLSADLPPEEKGYSAPIDMLIGLSVEGHLTGLKILDYVESFRYSRGDFLASEGFQPQFSNKPLSDEFRLRRDVDGVSGATISSWAITRAARDASRRVATAYLQYEEDDAQERAWEANARELLEQWNWEGMVAEGLVQEMTIPMPVDLELHLAVTYAGRRVLGEFLVGPDAYAQAEKDASIRFDGGELVLVAVSGSASHLFRQERLAVQQGDSPPQRVQPRRFVYAGNAGEGALAGHAAYAGAIVLEEDIDVTRPFTVVYEAQTSLESYTAEYQLNGLGLALANDEPILSAEEIRAAEIAESGLLTRLRYAPPWGETPWVEVSLLLVLLVTVITAFLRKSERLRWMALTATLFYLGFVDGGFLSISHLTGVLAQGPGILLNNLPALILIVFTLATTLLWGRVFCSSLCPFGALQDMLSRFTPRQWQFRMPQAIHDRALTVKYGILLLIVAVALLQSDLSIFQYFEPFGTLFFFSSSVVLWSILVVILLASMMVKRFYCRYVCPLGAALGILSLLSPLRIKRVPQCTLCKVCESGCPTGAIRGAEIDFKECVRCDLCEIKLIRQAGSCRHDVDEITRRAKAKCNPRRIDTIELIPAEPA